MDTPNTNPSPDAPRPIETASATTSPSNSSSGPFAYIIAALALVACFAMGFMAKGCTTLVGEVVGDEVLNDHDVWDEFDEFMQEDDPLLDDDNDYGDWTDRSQRITLVEVLDEDLALYSSIDAQVGALAYANVQLDVQEAVRALVLIDRNAANDIASLLRTSAGDEDLARDAVAQAKEKAADALTELKAYEIPHFEGENGDEVADCLADAKESTIERWEAIQAELDALVARDRLSVDDINDLDDDVYDATCDAAEEYLEALSEARHL